MNAHALRALVDELEGLAATRVASARDSRRGAALSAYNIGRADAYAHAAELLAAALDPTKDTRTP